MAVLFKKAWSRWEVGDRATFNSGHEQRLIDKGICSRIEAKPHTEEVMQPTNRQTTTDRRVPAPTNRQTTTGGKPKGK